MRRLLALVLAVLALIGVLSGCAGIPDRSPVQQRLPIGGVHEEPPVDVQPQGPEPGAPPAQVAAGFVRAHIGLSDRWTTAKQFLTPTAAREWDPGQGVSVLRDGLSVRQEDGAVVVGATVIAQVSADGHLTQLRTPRTTELRLPVGRVDGQWRVSGVPASLGLWLSRSSFENLYQERSVYFASVGDERVLVPDERWLPKRGVSTALARAVLRPPPEWLQGAVARTVPPPTQLVGSVPVTADGVATVELSPEALGATPQARQMLWASMLETLNDATGVGRVRITVRGAPLAAPGVTADVISADDLGYRIAPALSGPVVVRTAEGLQWYDQRGQEPGRPARGSAAGEPALPAVGVGWQSIAADSKTGEVAAVSADGRTIGRWVNGTLSTRAPFARRLVRPAYDGIDGLWLAGEALGGPTGAGARPTSGAATVWVVNTRQSPTRAQPQPVDVPGLAGQDVLAIAVSPEGQRIALALRDRRTGASTAMLYAVVHDPADQGVRLTTPRRLSEVMASVSDLGWVDGSALVVLGRTASDPGTTQPVLVPLNRPAEPMGPVEGAQHVVGGTASQYNIAVLTDRGTVVTRQGRGWGTELEAQDLAVPAP